MSDLTAILRQIHGMAIKGCEAPSAAYRWCERINEVMHLGAPVEEYEPWGADLPPGMQKLADAKRTVVNTSLTVDVAGLVEGRLQDVRREARCEALVGAIRACKGEQTRLEMTARTVAHTDASISFYGRADTARHLAAVIGALLEEPPK